jgi:hypothetical protein
LDVLPENTAKISNEIKKHDIPTIHIRFLFIIYKVNIVEYDPTIYITKPQTITFLSSNPFNGFKINSKLFRKARKKPSNTQVFLTNEQPLKEDAAFNDFIASGYTTCLAIPLSHQLGTRFGEIVTLKWDDINDELQDQIHIQRMEIKTEKKDEKGNWLPTTIIVVEHTKSSAGDRNVFLTE